MKGNLTKAALFEIRDRTGKEPCGECHIQLGETCDVCGASQPQEPKPAGREALRSQAKE